METWNLRISQHPTSTQSWSRAGRLGSSRSSSPRLNTAIWMIQSLAVQVGRVVLSSNDGLTCCYHHVVLHANLTCNLARSDSASTSSFVSFSPILVITWLDSAALVTSFFSSRLSTLRIPTSSSSVSLTFILLVISDKNSAGLSFHPRPPSGFVAETVSLTPAPS